MTTYPTDRPVGAPAPAPEYDALAELFLGGEARATPAPSRIEHKPIAAEPSLRLAGVDEPEPEPVRQQRAVIDAVILGSLPVYASAWLLQHARHEAEKHAAPVALVRLLSGECSVDVVGVTQDGVPAPAFASLDAALAFVSTSCVRVLLRTGETSEQGLASHDAVGSITILTGVDDPALVAAYRTIKAIHASDRAVRVATMGAPLADGKKAFDKISRASLAFLETPVEFAGHVEKIEPAPSVCLHRGASRVSLETVLATLCDPEVIDEEPVVESSGPSAVSEPERAPHGEFIADSDPAPVVHEIPVIAEAAPVVVPIVEAAPSLASRVAGLALTPLKAPRCERVEIAVDAVGRVHLLLADHDEDDSRGSVATLLAAQAWAQTNAQLLAAACATILGAAVDADAAPALHLFTSDPRRVRPLLDADIRLHFLGRVEIDGRRAWCVAELN